MQKSSLKLLLYSNKLKWNVVFFLIFEIRVDLRQPNYKTCIEFEVSTFLTNIALN